MSEDFVFPRTGAYPAAIDDILAGERYAAVHAFVWDDTPQGHDYWEAIHEEEAELTDEDRAYLIRLRDAALEREKANG